MIPYFYYCVYVTLVFVSITKKLEINYLYFRKQQKMTSATYKVTKKSQGFHFQEHNS